LEEDTFVLDLFGRSNSSSLDTSCLIRVRDFLLELEDRSTTSPLFTSRLIRFRDFLLEVEDDGSIRVEDVDRIRSGFAADFLLEPFLLFLRNLAIGLSSKSESVEEFMICELT